jgi:ubiquinone biosynthesis protein COQ9
VFAMKNSHFFSNLPSWPEGLQDAALARVSTNGWNTNSLKAAADDVGLDWLVAQAYWPLGCVSLLQRVEQAWQERFAALAEGMDLSGMGTTARVRALVLARLEMLAPQYRLLQQLVQAAVRQPRLAWQMQQGVWQASSQLWYLAGDRATDHNWYSKRALLAAVYSSTLYYWLRQAGQPGDAAGQGEAGNQGGAGVTASVAAYLDRRLAEVRNIPKMQEKILTPFTKALTMLGEKFTHRTGSQTRDQSDHPNPFP